MRYRDCVAVTFESDIRSSQQREIALVGDGKDDPVVPVLKDITMIVIVEARHDQMAALYQSQIVVGFLRQGLSENIVDPGTGGVDDCRACDCLAQAFGALQPHFP